MKKTFLGIDGGATKVAGSVVEKKENDTYQIASKIVEVSYHDSPSYLTDFTPINIDSQLKDDQEGELRLSIDEERQCIAYAEACEEVINRLLHDHFSHEIYVGLGMPGTKTNDKRGIKIMNNGPRMPRFLDILERRMDMAELKGLSIKSLREDNDLCGLGELYSENGEFRRVNNALYIGGGTGIADAIMMNGEHKSFLEIKDWMPRTWQMEDHKGFSYEYLTSQLGIMNQYSKLKGIPVHELKRKQIYPSTILMENENIHDRFINGLSELISKRIELFFEHRQSVFDKIICALHLGALLNDNKELFLSVSEKIIHNIKNSNILNTESQEWYLENTFLTISHLTHAPIIGGGVKAYLDSQ